MTWKTIRLELARTREFPAGSASRAYLIRLPVNEDGAIDEAAISRSPARATVRRFWPCEPDQVGNIVHTEQGWALRTTGAREVPLILEPRQLKLGGQVLVTDGNCTRLPFRIASIRNMG